MGHEKVVVYTQRVAVNPTPPVAGAHPESLILLDLVEEPEQLLFAKNVIV